MLVAAGNTAKHKIERKTVDEMTAYRYEQYFETKKSGFFDCVAVPLEVLDLKGNVQGRIAEDVGVRSLTVDALRGMRTGAMRDQRHADPPIRRSGDFAGHVGSPCPRTQLEARH